MHNWRGCYCEFTGDGSTTSIVIPNAIHYTPQTHPGVATVVTGPTSFSHQSGKGGFLLPFGTAVPVSRAAVTNGAVTINTTAAVGNGTKAYAAFV